MTNAPRTSAARLRETTTGGNYEIVCVVLHNIAACAPLDFRERIATTSFNIDLIKSF